MKDRPSNNSPKPQRQLDKPVSFSICRSWEQTDTFWASQTSLLSLRCPVRTDAGLKPGREQAKCAPCCDYPCSPGKKPEPPPISTPPKTQRTASFKSAIDQQNPVRIRAKRNSLPGWARFLVVPFKKCSVQFKKHLLYRAWDWWPECRRSLFGRGHRKWMQGTVNPTLAVERGEEVHMHISVLINFICSHVHSQNILCVQFGEPCNYSKDHTKMLFGLHWMIIAFIL